MFHQFVVVDVDFNVVVVGGFLHWPTIILNLTFYKPKFDNAFFTVGELAFLSFLEKDGNTIKEVSNASK